MFEVMFTTTGDTHPYPKSCSAPKHCPKIHRDVLVERGAVVEGETGQSGLVVFEALPQGLTKLRGLILRHVGHFLQVPIFAERPVAIVL